MTLQHHTEREPRTVPKSAYVNAFDDLPREHGFEPLEVIGREPEALRGTLYATGPSIRRLFGQTYGHWFDGDGAVSAVRLGERAEGAVRVVQTKGLLEERRAGRPLFGGFGHRFHWKLHLRHPLKRAKNAANTAMLVQDGRVFALWEGGRATEVDPETLRTLGEEDFGVVKQAFGAHPHRVAGRDELYDFGIRIDKVPSLDVYAVDGRGRGRLLARPRIGHFTMLHDFIATERHLVFFVSPLRLKVLPTLAGLRGLSENLAWEPERGTEILVVPLDRPQEVTRWRTEAFYQWHFVNAFERGDDLVVDVIRYPDFQTMDWLRELWRGEPLRDPGGSYDRVTLTPKSKRAHFETRWSGSTEFPQVHPGFAGRRHRFAYMAAHDTRSAVREGLQNALLKLDADTGEGELLGLGEGRYPGEPRFVPHPEGGPEDRGWLLSHVYDAATHRTFLAVVDARSMQVEAELWFDHHVPPRFHGDWLPA